MPRGEAREIARRDQAPPGDIFEVAGELRPEGRLERDLLAHRDDAEVGERRLRLRHALVDLARGVALDRDRHVMLAEAGAAGGDLVLGAGEVGAQAHRLVLGRAHPSQRQVHPRQRRLAVDEAEALGDGELERQPQQFVEHARRGLAGIVLDRNHANEAALEIGARPQLDRLLAEADPAIGQIGAQVLHRHQHRAHLAIVEGGEELERLRARPLGRLVDAEQPRRIAAERRQQGIARDVELARLIGGAGVRLGRGPPEHHAEPVERPGAALQRTADQGQEKVVDVEPLGRQPRPPHLVELAREGIDMAGAEADVDPAADDMVVEGEARRADRLQHRVAQALAVVDLLAVGGLEEEAAQMDHLHQQAVAGLDRVVVDVARVGKVLAGRQLAGDDPGVAGQGR